MFALRTALKNASPTGAVGDFMTVFQQAGPNRWWITLVAAATSFTMIWALVHGSWKKERQLPTIVYITTFAPDRTAAESLAFRKERTAEREALEARIAAADAETRRLYKELGRASGMDVDDMEKRANAERAAAAAAEKARIDAILKQGQAGGAKAVGKR